MNLMNCYMQTQDKERMIIPSLYDVRNGQQAKVDSQCRECAKQLATHLYVWKKPFPQKSTVKKWDAKSLCFTGMDIDFFASYLMNDFSVRTDDNREWLLDRCIAALIWNACTEDSSPLPLASWELKELKKEAS